MSEIRSAAPDTRNTPWVMLAVARDVETAERWQDTLDDRDIGSEIRLEDAVITGRSTATTYANSPGVDQLFAYAVWVPASDREAAAAALSEAGWDGNYGQRGTSSMSPGYVIRGTLIALAISALFVAILLRAGAG